MKRLFLIFGLSAASVLAQPEPSPEALTAAEVLTKTIGLDKQMQQGFTGLMPMVENLAQRMKLSAPDTEQLKGIYRSWFTEDLDQAKLAKSVVQLYAESFTVDELVKLNEFYQSPLGAKTLVALPELMKKSSAVGLEEAKAKQALLQKRLAPFLEAHRPPTPEGGPTPPPAPPAAPKN